MRAFYAIGLTAMLAVGMPSIGTAQENPPRPGIQGVRSIDQELDHLTKDLELTPDQRKQIRPLLEEHHDRIQALLDKIQSSRAETSVRRSTPSATKHTTRLKRC